MLQGIAHIPPGEGRSLWVLGELVTYKTTREQTGGAYSLIDVGTQPGVEPPPHIHHREDESFYVLEGEYEFLIDRRTVRVAAGSLLCKPKGTLHAHKNVGEGVGRILLTQTPGGLYERFFEEVGKPVDGDDGGPLVLNDEPDVGKIVEAATTYGIEISLPIAQLVGPGLSDMTETRCA